MDGPEHRDRAPKPAAASEADSDSPIARTLDEIVLSSLRPITVGLAGLFAIFSLSHPWLLDPGIASAMTLVAGLTATLFFVLWLFLSFAKVPPKLAHPIGAGIASLVLFNSLLHLWLSQEPRLTTNLLLLVLGMGILFLDTGWFALLVGAAFTGWVVVLTRAPSSPEWIHFGFALVGATVLATVLLQVRIRTVKRIEALHRDDRMRRLELESALERTEAARRGEAEARRELEAAVTQLTESEERFRRLGEATFEGVVVHQGGRIVDANRRAAQLFGYPLSELVHKRVIELVAPEARAEVREALERSDGTEAPRGGDGVDLTWECTGLRKDGSRFPLQLSMARASHKGKPANVVVARDVTAQRRIQEMLTQAVEEAEASNLAKSVFLANMSHELRTPLNAVIGFSNVLRKNREENLGEKELEYLDRIVSNGKHLLALINDVLDLSKIEAGRVDLERAPIELRSFVEDVVRSVDIQAKTRGLELTTSVPDGLDPLDADPGRLRQVLINLVGNAVKFTDEGEVRVEVVADGDGRVPKRIEVHDTGIGIPANQIGEVFSAFRQVDPSTSRKYGGTGLGLTISRSLCELMGFTLEVESELGRGSTFTIDLAPTFVPARSEPETGLPSGVFGD